MKNNGDPSEITLSIKGNIERLLPEEQDQVIEFLESRGESVQIK